MKDESSSAGDSSTQDVNAAMYKEMRMALHEFECSCEQTAAPPRAKAFYGALRTVLGDCVEEQDQCAQATRLTAAHQWFVKHRPRQMPSNPAMAAAQAASLSVQQQPVAVRAPQHHPPDQQQQQRQSMAATSMGGWQRQQPAPGTHPSDTADADACRWSASDSGTDASGAERSSNVPGSDPAARRYSGTPSTSSAPQQACPSTHSRPEWSSWVQPEGASQQQASLGRQPALHNTQPRAAPSTARRRAPQQEHAHTSTAATALARNSSGEIRRSSEGSSWQGSIRQRDSSTARQRSGAGTSQPSISSSVSINSGSGVPGLGADEAAGRWKEAARQQEGFDRAVQAELALHAQHRARLEQEIMRRQEALRLMQHTAHAAGPQPRARSATAAAAAGPGSRAPSAGNAPFVARCLARMDSGQTSHLSAYNGLQETLVQQLAHVDPIKAARRKLQAQSATECAQVTQQLQRLGMEVAPGAVAHALLPAPDQPYLTCLARLPKPGTLLCVAKAGEAHRKRHKRRAS